MRRRRFLGLAAFAGTTVIGVGVAAAPAAASTASTAPSTVEPEQQLHTIDKDTGWPVYSGAQPPKGYVRRHMPCDHGQYVDVPTAAAATRSLDGVTVLHAPYKPGGKQ